MVASCQASGYGGGAGGYGGSAGGGVGGGGGSSGGSGVGPVSGFGGGPVTAAVQSSHTVEIRHVNVPMELPQPQIVEVEAGNLPLTIHFKSASSALNVVQTHQPGLAGDPQHTTSEDEPHRLVHEVTKPVIQEVREIITPYRRVIQEIKPVQEEIQTIIAKGEPRPNLDAASLAAGGFGGSGGVSGGGGGFGGTSGSGLGGGLKTAVSGHYAAAATNNQQSSITASHSRSSSSKSANSQSAATGSVSYFNDGLSGVAFAQAGSPVATSSSSSSSGTKSSSSSASGSSIRIIEGGSSRSSGLSSINAYKSRA